MHLLDNRRMWLAGGAIVAVLLVALSWLLLLGPELSAASSAKAAKRDAVATNEHLRTTISALRKQDENLQALTATLASALAALPPDTALPAFNRQISDQAQASGIQVTSITVGDPTSGSGQATTAAATGQVMQIPVTLVTAGPGPKQVTFLKALQYGGPRRVLVTGASLQSGSGTGGGSVDTQSTLTVQATLFFTSESAAKRADLQRLLAGDVSR